MGLLLITAKQIKIDEARKKQAQKHQRNVDIPRRY